MAECDRDRIGAGRDQLVLEGHLAAGAHRRARSWFLQAPVTRVGWGAIGAGAGRAFTAERPPPRPPDPLKILRGVFVKSSDLVGVLSFWGLSTLNLWRCGL